MEKEGFSQKSRNVEEEEQPIPSLIDEMIDNDLEEEDDDEEEEDLDEELS